MRAIKSRRYQLTLNEIDKYDDVLKYLTGLKNFKFLYSCKEEAPSTGHKHIHIYVAYSNAISLSTNKTCGSHIEICRGTHKQNMDYIEKGGEIIDKIGEEPKGGFTGTVRELSQITNPDDIPPHLFNVWKTVRTLPKSFTREEMYKPGVKVFYIWGSSGAGKTKYVFDNIGEGLYDRVSYVNGFWIGVNPFDMPKTAWYDDFRPSDMKPSEFVKFIDYYVNVMNIKGGHAYNRYETIFITSVIDPTDLYLGIQDEEPRRQWLRRMEIIHIE